MSPRDPDDRRCPAVGTRARPDPAGVPARVRPVAENRPISRRKALRLLAGRGDVLPLLPAPVAVGGLVAGAVLTRNPLVVTFTAGVLLSGGWTLLRRRRSVPGIAVHPRVQPELAALVADTAARLGLPAPRRVLLAAGVTSSAVPARLPWRQGAVYLGVGAVAAMPGGELWATVAHELAHLAGPDGRWCRRRLVGRLLAERRAAAERWARLPDHRRAEGRLLRFLAETLPLARAEELRADAAALRVVDRATAARALAREHAAGLRFAGYVMRCVAPLVASGMYPEELPSGFAAWCTTPVFVAEEFLAAATTGADPLADEHPGLADRIRVHAGDPAPDLVVPHPDTVVRPLGRGEEAVLSRRFASRSGLAPRFRVRRLRPVRWVDVPTEVYDSCDTWLRASLVEAATGVLGRPARDTDVADLIAVGLRAKLQPWLATHLARRGADAATARASAAVPDATLLAVLAFPALRSRGYRRSDPLAQHVLTGPDGHRLDLAAASAEALTDERAFLRLRGWLSGASGRG